MSTVQQTVSFSFILNCEFTSIDQFVGDEFKELQFMKLEGRYPLKLQTPSLSGIELFLYFLKLFAFPETPILPPGPLRA